jgi:tetratricopeptide (TPR) repeat protein
LKSLPAFGPPPQRRSPNIAQEQLSRALNLHQQGRLLEAKQLYEAILKSQKTHVDALQLLGLIHHQTGNAPEAERLLSKAIRLNPKVASFHYNYGLVLQRLGSFDDAVASYDRALALKPDYAEAWLNRGITLHECGAYDEALKSLDRALALNANLAEAHSARGSTLQALGRLDEALASFERAIALNPDYAEAHYNCGNVLQALSRFEEAIVSYDRALALRPDFAQAHANRGSALKELRRFDEALVSYDRALAIDPNYAEAHSNRGSTLKELKRADEAVLSHDRAIALQPDFADAHYNRGMALQRLERFDEALASYDRAIALKPGFADAYWSKSLLLLLRGDYQNGWPLYEWRWQIRNVPSKPLVTGRPTWAGVENRRVLVWAEQGVGDELMFGSLLPDLQEACSKVIARLDARLIPLFARSMPDGIDFVASHETVDENDYDEQIAMGSLGKHFRNREADFAGTRGGFLVDDAARTASIRTALKANRAPNGKICGISWRSKNEKTGADRSLDLKEFVELLSLDGVDFVSLQYGDTAEEIARAQAELGVTVVDYRDVDNFNDIDGLASLIKACDLVVSVDNTTVHLAGALGQDTRVLLPALPDWRWALGRDDSPWYASLKLYRQERGRGWAPVFEKVRADLS